jgi:acyl-coenzyme A synthetase/AMP-(fatty) acid ligase
MIFLNFVLCSWLESRLMNQQQARFMVRSINQLWTTTGKLKLGWPMLAIQRGVEGMPNKFGSPGVPSFGYNMKLLDDATSEELGPDQKV